MYEWGFDESRRNTICSNIVFRPLAGQVLGELIQCS